METPRNSQKLSQIAVVAVHGVSDQKPFDYAQAIANMLLSLNNIQYTAFAEKFIRIVVRPLNKTSQNLSDVDLQFINEQIENYQPNSINDNIYNSIRLEGKCISEDNQTEQTVHIYEMYWADLSRLGTGFIRIFGELYQIFFHLISLGNLVLDWACNFYCQIDSNNQNFDKLLGYWKQWQLRTGNLLALFIPILNLYLLIAACLSLPINISESYCPFVVKISLIIILTLITGWFLLKSNIKNFLAWLLLPLIVIFLGILLLNIFDLFSLEYYRLITLEWLILLSVTCWFLIITPYNRHCPGVIKVATWLGVPLGVFTAFLLFTMGTNPENLTRISLNLIEVIYSLLFLTWLSFHILYFVTLVLSYITIKNLKLSSAISAIKKTAWTARLSLAIPAILFLFLTLTLWRALANISESLLLETEFYKPLILGLFFPDFKDKIFTAPQFLQQLTEFSASPVALFVVIVFAIAVIIAIWSLFPAIWSDIQPPNTEIDHNSSESEALGNWLTNGFIAMIATVSILLCFLIPLLFLAGSFLSKIPSENWQEATTILDIAAGILTASATSLIAFGDRLNRITLGLRGVLDVALDVDNYLRLYPKEDNPRARIFARYKSLLRYLCQWRSSK